jgi:PAS domain S-box-containing protein
MLDYEKLTKAELIEALKSFQAARSMDENEREQLVHELQVHQMELEMQNQELREIQQQLEDTNNLYADLYDFAPVGYLSFNDNGFIQEINLTGATLLGKERSHLMNTPFATYVMPSDLRKFRDHLYHCRQTKENVTTEVSLIVKKDAVIQVQMSSVAVYDIRRRITLYRTAFSDITYQKRAEEALRETRNYLDKLIQYANAPIIVWDPQLRITRFNHAFEHLTGHYAAKVIGQELQLLFPESSRTDSLQKIAATLSGEYWDSVEIPVLCQDGGIRVALWNSANIYAEDGRTLIATIAQGQDITERKRMEETLQKLSNELETMVQERTSELTEANQALQKEISERKQAEENLAAESERLNVTLRSIADGVIAINSEGKIVLINKSAENLTGWTQKEANDRSFSEVLHIMYNKTDIPYEDLEFSTLKISDISDYNRDIVLVAKDGSEHLIAVSGAPLQDTRGNNIGTVLVLRDITKQRNLEDELLKTQKLESLGILAGGIAHDFNNFLAAIMASAQLASIRLTKGMDIHKNLMDIEGVINKAAGLTKQLLTFSKGGAPVKKTAFIADLIRETVDFTLHGTKLKCEFTSADDLWLAKVDEGQMSQVINNLVLNAVQAMPDGGAIKIRVENVKLAAGHIVPLPPGNYVKITIADQGVGIPEEHLSKVFDPYFTTKHNGNGLGLASSYTIIKKHKGYIGVQSQLGVGTTFEIYLPASKRKSGEREPTPELIPDGAGKILLMDDEASIRDVTGEMLSQIGYEVAVAADGAEAVALYSQAKESGSPYDVIITDLTIPGGMGGKDVIAKLLLIDPEVKAIISSGYSNDPVMSDYREYGFNDLVIKPYKIEELHQKILKIIRGK